MFILKVCSACRMGKKVGKWWVTAHTKHVSYKGVWCKGVWWSQVFPSLTPPFQQVQVWSMSLGQTIGTGKDFRFLHLVLASGEVKTQRSNLHRTKQLCSCRDKFSRIPNQLYSIWKNALLLLTTLKITALSLRWPETSHLLALEAPSSVQHSAMASTVRKECELLDSLPQMQ